LEKVAADDSHTTGLAGRYATAIFDLALEEKAVDALARDLVQLRVALETSEDLLSLVRSPVLSREDQTRALEAVLTTASAHPLTRKLVLLLAEKRRLFVLADVIRGFETLLARHRGEIAATVTSARPLNENETAELKRILKEKLGREPKLETRVDPKLLGGLVLKVGSRMIDSSLRAKLDGLRLAMRGN
jgi:F-type H+-transporting ATPase subunit delta